MEILIGISLLYLQIKKFNILLCVRAPFAVEFGSHVPRVSIQLTPVPVEGFGCVIVFDGKQRIGIDVFALCL